MFKKDDNVEGRPAIETDEPMSIQEANLWAVEQRDKADARKAMIERLKCAAAQRRERKPANPLETLKLNPSYRVGEFNAEADAFNVANSEGKKLLGKSLSNGNVRNGQKVRSFFTPTGRVVIDVKPKGRDIIIPKPLVKAPTDKEIYPCTVGLLYCEINLNTVDLTDNGLATGDETSWDYTDLQAWSSSNINSSAYVFGQQFNRLGDYSTGANAVANILKPDRLIVPVGGTSSGAQRDNLAGNSVDSVIVWFYVGELNNSGGLELVQNNSNQIFRVDGTSTIIGGSNTTESGPGACMQMYLIDSSMSSSLYPISQINSDPLARYLITTSFPDLGGSIGYVGNIFKWHGMQDYPSGSNRQTLLYRFYWDAGGASGGLPYYPNETVQVPTSYPPEWTSGTDYSAWQLENAAWYRFGWNNQKIACLSGGMINVKTEAIVGAGFNCGDSIPSDKWGWAGGVGSSAGALDKRNNYSNADGMFVCWKGHKDHIGMAQSFFEAFRTYWNIPGIVTKLKSCNPYGCELPNNGGYPSPPPTAPSQRYLARYWGRKASIYLKVHKEHNDLPLKIKLPIEFAACTEQIEIIGGGSFSSGVNFNTSTAPFSRTYSQHNTSFGMEMIHATLSMDDKFIYVDVFCGGERIREAPLTKPVRTKLSRLGFGDSSVSGATERVLGFCLYEPIVGAPLQLQAAEVDPRVVKDCFTSCHSFVYEIPTNKDIKKGLTLINYQKYNRGEIIAITSPGQDNELNQKFLICDHRTNLEVYLDENQNNIRWTPPNLEFASFGGLPALLQLPYYGPSNVNTLVPRFYKNQLNWTQLDWIYWQLQEGPRQFNPLSTVLPQGVTIARQALTGVFFEFDKKFGRHGRAECILPTSSFGYNNTSTGGNPPQYGDTFKGHFLLSTLFSEQLRGNAIKENGSLVKWFRISVSSFPVHGQLTRNG